MKLEDGARVAGVFTQNRFCAAPVIVAREHLAMLGAGASIRALVVNTGSANAGTGGARARGGAPDLRRARAAPRLRAVAGAAVLDRRHHGAAAGGEHRGGAAGVPRGPASRTTGSPRRRRS